MSEELIKLLTEARDICDTVSSVTSTIYAHRKNEMQVMREIEALQRLLTPHRDRIDSALAAQQEPTEPVAWFPLLGTGLAIRRNLLNEEFAQRNHSQTLTRLAERGGLSIDEAVANISRTQWKSRETKDALAELAKLTAPLSGVRERIALQELRNIVNAKRFDVEVFDDDTAFADWAQSRARHAITRAADQVNEAIEDEREACARISDRWENSTISDEIRERNLT